MSGWQGIAVGMTMDKLMLELACALLIPYSFWKVLEGVGDLRRVYAARIREARSADHVPPAMMVTLAPMDPHESLLELESALILIQAEPLQDEALNADQVDGPVSHESSASGVLTAIDHPLFPEFTEAFLQSITGQSADKTVADDSRELSEASMVAVDDCEPIPERVNINYSRIIVEKMFQFNEQKQIPRTL